MTKEIVIRVVKCVNCNHVYLPRKSPPSKWCPKCRKSPFVKGRGQAWRRGKKRRAKNTLVGPSEYENSDRNLVGPLRGRDWQE